MNPNALAQQEAQVRFQIQYDYLVKWRMTKPAKGNPGKDNRRREENPSRDKLAQEPRPAVSFSPSAVRGTPEG